MKPAFSRKPSLLILSAVLILAATQTVSLKRTSAFSGSAPEKAEIPISANELTAFYSGPPVLKQALEQNKALPLALASGDFDEDGAPDLIAGYAGPNGKGITAFHRGNIDSIYPNSPEARLRKAAGAFVDAPFLSPAIVFEMPEAPEFLSAGDFDADGHLDIAAAARGSKILYLFPGDGRAGFRPAQPIGLPGRVTALAEGEINRRDGLNDLVVGIAAADGAKALVFEGPEGALRSVPEILSLPAETTSIALGQLDDDPAIDLAAAAGKELVIIKGRDRKLSLDEAQRQSVDKAIATRRSFPFKIKSAAIGDFIGDARTDIAVLSQSGDIQILERVQGTENEEKWAPSRATNIAPSAQMLIAARVSTNSNDDLLALDSIGNRLQILTEKKTNLPDALDVIEPAAVLPMRLNGDALNDLVVLKRGGRSSLAVIGTNAAMTYTVNSTGDGSDSNTADGLCDDGEGNCTLRAAIQQANANSGADAINFSIGTGLQTITLASLLPAITDPVTIDGTTQPEFSGSPLIEINGNNLIGNGLTITAGSSTVRGIVINRFGSNSFNNGIAILLTSGGNLIEGCFIGTNAAGDAAGGNGGSGIRIQSSNNTIGGTAAAARNIISGNNTSQMNAGGLNIIGTTSVGNIIRGNYVGTDATGKIVIGNVFGGVYLSNSQNNTIGGTTAGARNVISGNGNSTGTGIVLESADVNGNLVQGNYIGVDVDGVAALPNIQGIAIVNGGSLNTFGGTVAGARNIISGNQSDGITFSSANDGNIVQGNYIGTDATGIAALGNGQNGIRGSSQDVVIGGTAAGARNIISGNTGDGINVQGGGEGVGNFVQGNFIGTDVTGTAALGNGLSGINLSGKNFTIGGTTAAARNVISGNMSDGIALVGGKNGGGNSVQGNFIGTDAAGTSALGNGSDGISMNGQFNLIGGTMAGSRNVISGNMGNGILITGNGNSVQGNIIGADAAGASALANAQDGVFINFGRDNTIGGSSSAANTIAFNSRNGISVRGNSTGDEIVSNAVGSLATVPGTNNAVLSNKIFSNAGLGIDLGFMSGQDGVTPNDAGDADAGANNLQNFPVLTSAASGNGRTTVQGTLNSTANTTFIIQFFSNASCDSSGNGEGETFLGSTTVTANGNGDVGFTFSLSTAIALGQRITATASDFAGGNTSEFSQCFEVTAANGAAPTITSFTPVSGSIGATVTVTGTNFTGATSVALNGMNTAFNVVSATSITFTVPVGASTGLIAVTTAGGTGVSATAFKVLPSLTNFTPAIGDVGDEVTITGVGLLDVTDVKFSGVSAAFRVLSSTSLIATVPSGAITGKISITTPGGAVTSANNFTVLSPFITSFTPTSGVVGTFVTLTGGNFTNDIVAVRFTNEDGEIGSNSNFFFILSPTSLVASVPSGAVTGKIGVVKSRTGGGEGDLTSQAISNEIIVTTAADFKVLPKIDSFSPDEVLPGDTVAINGSNIANPTSVKFGTVSAEIVGSSYNEVSVKVPAGFTISPAKISLTTAGGTAVSVESIFLIKAPTITSIAPASAPIFAVVTITGTNFSIGPTSVKFNGITVGFGSTDTTIGTNVPIGATTGKITVGNRAGVATSAVDFKVAPRIDNISSGSGIAGDSVTITGLNLKAGNANPTVKIGAVTATVTSATISEVVFTVPSTAITGKVMVTTVDGTGISANDFIVIKPPTITSFTPLAAGAGATVTITGTNFSAATAVQFNGASAEFSVVSATSIRATVPMNATSGKISVTNRAGTATSVAIFKVAPSITSFTPASGITGTQVTVTGLNFTGATSVRIGAVAVTPFTVNPDGTQITFNVPATAVTGKISVTTADGTGISANDFIVIKVPTITSFTPLAAGVGATVTITGTNFSAATAVQFNGASAEFTIVSATSIRATAPMNATSGKISVTTPAGTATSVAIFKVASSITSFTPASGITGTQVTVTGLNFTGATSVRIGAVAVTPFTVNPDGTQITFNVPATAVTGKISVTTANGTGISANDFIVIKAPTITSFTPLAAGVGATVTITGTNFSAATAVQFNGASAEFTIVSATSIRATAPMNATSGKISVTTPAGTATSVAIFKVASSITSFTPASGITGTQVTVTGLNFTGATSVRIGAVAVTPFTVNPDGTQITFNVPATAVTGKISVTTANGTGISANDFIVIKAPTITSFTPLAAGVGATVTINGTNFSAATAVQFNGASAEFTIVSATSIRATAPMNATTGKISVTTPAGTATSVAIFKVIPRIDDISPNMALAGETVTITGLNFTGATSVKIGAVAVTPFTVNPEGTQITFIVPANAATGKISVTIPDGTGISADNLTVIKPPTITSFSPTSARTNTNITITGMNLSSVDEVQFSGNTRTSSITVISATSISVRIPGNTITGKIVVVNPAGAAISAGILTILP